MKILFFSGGLYRPGGTERVLVEVADSLAERGYEICIVSLTGEKKAFYEPDKRIKIYYLEAENFSGHLVGNLKKLVKITKKEKPDVWVDVDTILCMYSIPLRFLCHGFHLLSWAHFNHNSTFSKNRFIRRISTFAAAHLSDGMIVLTEFDKKYYQRRFGMGERLYQIYNPNPFENTGKKTKYGKYIFAAGNLVPEKGFDFLIEVWSRLEKKYPDWHVVIAGDGSEKTALKREVKRKKLANLHFVGRVPKIEKYYENASIYALTSRYEGFPTVVMEAMAYSLPVVALGKNTCVTEMFDDGVSGIVVKKRDVDEFAQKLELLMQNSELAKRIGNEARRKVADFSHEKIISEWEKMLKKVTV